MSGRRVRLRQTWGHWAQLLRYKTDAGFPLGEHSFFWNPDRFEASKLPHEDSCHAPPVRIVSRSAAIMAFSIDEFVAKLESTQALAPDQLEAIRKEIEPVQNEVDTECYARKLVKEGTLTQWQSEQLFAGRKHFVMGDYRLLDMAGRGGMGAVFKAEHVRLKRLVAMKTLAPELVDKPAQVARFQKEIEAASALESPNVVRALDAIQVGRTYVLVMEFVQGEPLSRIGKVRGRLPAGEVSEYIRQAALGLQHAHEKGMVHRDIKPGNLILTWRDDGTPLVKVFDLGLARFVSERVDRSEMTRTGQVMGTPDYMSPEQGWDTRTVDIRGDIYSLGCTAFKLITGRVPFRGDNPLQTLMVRCSTDAPPIRSFLPDIPEPLDAVIEQMLARDPAERFQTPGELATAIVPFCESVSRNEFRQRAKKHVEPVPLPAGVAAGPEGDSDTGFGRFLTQTGGSSADVLGSEGGSGETLPDAGSETPLAFPHLSGPAVTSTSPVRTAKQKNALTDPKSIAAAAVVALCCLIGGAVWLFGGDDSQSPPGPGTTAGSGEANSKTDELKFVSVPQTEVDEGKPLRLALHLEGDSASRAGVTFQIVGESPEGLALDSKTGELTWTPAEQDGPGEFQVKVKAVRSGQQKSLAAQSVSLVVNEVDQPPKVEAVPPASVTAGEKLLLTVSASDDDLPASPLRFQLAPGAPRRAVIDPLSGEFEWTPPTGTSGQQTVLVLVSTQAHPKTHTAQAIRISVRPGQPALRLATVPPLKIKPGETARTTLKAIGVPPDAKLAFEFLTPPPDGAKLDAATGLFSWQPASTVAAGRYEVAVRVRVEGASLAAAGKLAVEVMPTSSPTGSNSGTVASVKPTGPTAEEIEKAEQQARELFRREITTARSVTERVDLAARLLTRAKESGSTPLALGLFRLAREYALKGRSVAIALEAVRIGSPRFGEDFVKQTTDCLPAFKPRGSTWFDEQQVVEVGLAAALVAVESGRFAESEKLIAVPETVLRRGKQFDEADRLKSALDFLKTIRAEVPDEKKRVELSESGKLALKELTSTLKSQQFRPLFESLDNVSFFRHSDRDLPDRGSSLWTIGDGAASLDVPKQPANTGFVDRSESLTSYTARMNVSTNTTLGMLCIGLPQTGSFEGLRLHLGTSQFCFLRKASGTEFLTRPTSPVTRSRAGWDQIEIRARPGHITILINNAVVIETAVDAETGGFLGLDAYLGNAAAPQIRLENVRVRAAMKP